MPDDPGTVRRRRDVVNNLTIRKWSKLCETKSESLWNMTETLARDDMNDLHRGVN